MFIPSGSAWMTSTAAPVAWRIAGPTTLAEPWAQSRTIRKRAPSIVFAIASRFAT
jgi:hypothetical protein